MEEVTQEEMEAAAQQAAEAEAKGKETISDEPDILLNSRLPKIRLPGPNRLLSEFASDLADKLQGCEIYQRGGVLSILNDSKDGLEIVRPQRLRTLVEEHLVCYNLGTKKETRTVKFHRTMTESDARGVVVARQFLRKLPNVEKIATARLPVMRKGGKIELLLEGYDADACTLTVPQCEYDESMSLPDAKKVIDDLLSEFRFADGGRSKAVAVSAMVGLFASGLLPRCSLRPTFVYLANAEGAGKTLLAKCAITPVHGVPQVDGAVKEGEETQKELITALKKARPYILFDNCKGHVNSPALEAFTTATVFGGRLLGTNDSFEAENNVTVFLTGNGCTVTGDLRRRSLFVEIFMEEERAEDRYIKRYLDDTALLDMRSELLAALWAHVREWDKAGRPKPSREHGSFQRWAEIIGGIVEFAGYGCPLIPAEIEGAADTESSDMRELVKHLAQAPVVKMTKYVENPEGKGKALLPVEVERFPAATRDFEGLVDLAEEHGLFENIVVKTGRADEIAPKTKTSLGRILAKNNGRVIGGARFCIQGKGRSRVFIAKKVMLSGVTS